MQIEKRHASHWSSIVSLAYSTLKDPLARGRLVLSHLMKHQSTHWTQRNHLNLSESQTSDERNENVDDPELLFEILAVCRSIKDFFSLSLSVDILIIFPACWILVCCLLILQISLSTLFL